MRKAYVEKFAEIVEKLRTADDRTAYRILCRLQDGLFLRNAVRSLVKRDFTLDKSEAIILLAHAIPQNSSGLNVDPGRGFYCGWCKNKYMHEKITIVMDCSKLKNVIMQIAYTKDKRTNALDFDDFAVMPPVELKAVVDGLEGFAEQKPGLWVRPLGEVGNLAHAKRAIKPIWNEVYGKLESFSGKWQ